MICVMDLFITYLRLLNGIASPARTNLNIKNNRYVNHVPVVIFHKTNCKLRAQYPYQRDES